MLLRCRHFLSLRRRSPKLSDCSPANRERELGSDRRETSYFYPADEVVLATVIIASTRGTHRSDDAADDDDADADDAGAGVGDDDGGDDHDDADA